ncbi:MAG TPA: hypothetical protein VG317_02580 [Pseudonocardiaceae bacterium]|jgi:hypothetical protein|nr:hypothetical protein [Pseudonocardiaceae bacterium]
MGMSFESYVRQQLMELAHRRAKAEVMAAVREALEQGPSPGADENTILGSLRELRGE